MSPRPDATPAYIEALAQPLLRPAFFVEVTFASGPVYLWSGYGAIRWNGQTWTGAGSLLQLSAIDDGATVEARGCSVKLSGIDVHLVANVMAEFQVGLPVAIYLGLFDGDGNLIASPVTSFAGRADQPTVTADGQTASIEIACESLLLDMNVPVGYRYTNQDQQIFYPGDRGFAWVNAIQNVPIYWNQLPNANGNP